MPFFVNMNIVPYNLSGICRVMKYPPKSSGSEREAVTSVSCLPKSGRRIEGLQ